MPEPNELALPQPPCPRELSPGAMCWERDGDIAAAFQIDDGVKICKGCHIATAGLALLIVGSA